MSHEAFENYGVPTYYMNFAVAEPAGGGNVRVWNCVKKCGILIPVCEMIIPAVDLVVAAKVVTQAATLVFNQDQMLSGVLSLH